MMHGIEIDPAVLAMIQPGAKVRHLFGYQTPNPTSEIWHIRAIVDDNYVVCRKWHAGRGWQYFLESMISFHLTYINGGLEAAQ